MEGTIGEVRMFAATFAPKNWSYCNGSIIAIRSNTALFSILGTTYGGDGQTTFALPNTNGRAVLGVGTSTDGNVFVLGQMAGTNNTTLLMPNLPSHTHTGTASVAIPAYSESGVAAAPTNASFSSLNGMYVPPATGSDVNLKAFNGTVVDGVTGNNQPLPVMQPSIGMNYIICMYGIFPYRN
jgi:microcystin-dependent protein